MANLNQMQLVLPRTAPLLSAPNATTKDDETRLVARAKLGEVGALDELMNRHRARILNLAFQITRDRDDAQDCAQEAFVRAFKNLGAFRAQSSFGTWLYRITLNVALEKERRMLTIGEVSPNEVNEVGDIPNDMDAKMALEWALDQLSPTLRIALVLREWHGLSYEEMASVCGVPVGTIRSRLSAARAEFRRLWNEMEAQ